MKCLLFGLLAGCLSWSAAAERPNFLVIAIDDLNDYVGCMGGNTDASTPNLDRLSQRGTLFTRAYCNSPVCNPSRAAIWTGLRPTTTGINSNPSGWLSAADYSTAAFGKLFHLGRGNSTEGEWQRFNNFGYGPRQEPKLNYPEGDSITDWGVPPEGTEDSASYDAEIADRVIDYLADRHDRPFLLGCGFFRPHTPLYATQEWFDLHPIDQISLPPGWKEGDADDLVYFGRKPRREQDIEAPGLFHQEWAEQSGKWKDVLQVYHASTLSMDHQLGRVLDAFDASRFSKNTYVILFSDHGWHLGEKRHWGKAALWEQTTRVPFIIAGPGLPRGQVCEAPVELLNIYPTVIDYAGVTPPHQLEGVSMRPLLEDPKAEWLRPALTTFVDHHALRTRTHRHIRYVDGSEELYDHRNDPHEWENLAVTRADDPGVQSALKELGEQLDSMLAAKNR